MNKSIAHGYWPEGKDFEFTSFGERAKDVLLLQNNQIQPDTVFTVAMLGDSFVWGNGVRFPQTVSQVLEKKLQKSFPKSQVYSLAMGGDSLLDHLAKIDMLQKTAPPDLSIIVLVNNDFLLRPNDNTYSSDLYSSIVDSCVQTHGNTPARHPDWQITGKEKEEAVNKAYLESYQNTTNICIFEEAIQEIEKRTAQKTIYFLTDYSGVSNTNDPASKAIIEILKKHQVTFIDPSKGKELPAYSKCWDSDQSLKECFYVTSGDPHPSKKAHALYSELLLQSIQEKNSKN